MKLTASSAAAASSATITFTGTAGPCDPRGLGCTDSAERRGGAACSTTPDITTFHDDNARDGLNAQETALTLNNVNATQFGKIGFDAVDGLVDGEPLFAGNLNAGGKVRNVLFVATEHDSVYAFDANSGDQIWKSSVLGPGETTSDSRNCGQVGPEIGITATPVLDRNAGANGTIFVVGMSKDGSGNYHQRFPCARHDNEVH